jgi:glucuronate isomerase
LGGEILNPADAAGFQSAFLKEIFGLYRDLGWTAQFHYGAARGQNLPMTVAVGADAGFDSIGTDPHLTGHVLRLIQSVHAQGRLPKAIIYPLNSSDWPAVATFIGNLQGEGRQRLQLGAAWWFNDHYAGIHEQLELFAIHSLIGNFTGMVTDSRSLLSCARHEYFRRILASHLSGWYGAGRVYGGTDSLIALARNVSYYNAKEWFAW